jgi:hypothetical protein
MQQTTNEPRKETRMDAPKSVIPSVIHHLKGQGFTTESRMFTYKRRSQDFDNIILTSTWLLTSSSCKYSLYIVIFVLMMSGINLPV